MRTLGNRPVHLDIDFRSSAKSPANKKEQIRRNSLFRRNFDDEAVFQCPDRLEGGLVLKLRRREDRAIEQNRLKDELKTKFQLFCYG